MSRNALGSNKKYLSEFKSFLEYHLFPVLGISDKNNNLEDHNGVRYEQLIFFENKYLFFSTNEETPFKLRYPMGLIEDNIKLGTNILHSFFNVSKYRLSKNSSKKNTEYFSDTHAEKNYEMAVQKGISTWILGKPNNCVEELLLELEKWSVKTYEGRKVAFGFIVNPNSKSNFDTSYGNWLNFLRDDFSAVITDCINSVIELDDECNFIKYLSITENDNVKGYDLINNLPFRFSNVIQQYVTEDRVGIFLLVNGDIILSKKQRILFLKRNLKWLNLSYEAFFNVLIESKEIDIKNNKLIESVFASVLDVSFSHCGGIIAIVKDIGMLTKEDDDGLAILSKSDNISNHMDLKELKSSLDKQNIIFESNNNRHLKLSEDEIKKRLLKRNVLNVLVGNKSFIQLDRKLRCELISLDGACILDLKGNVCSFGAIIKNDSGSSGGGRGAASRKLSNYGMAIKISTDGYIELFIQGKVKYVVK